MGFFALIVREELSPFKTRGFSLEVRGASAIIVIGTLRCSQDCHVETLVDCANVDNYSAVFS